MELTLAREIREIRGKPVPMTQIEKEFSKMLDGWFQRQFHPQIPFGPYRADFLHFGGLVVELDDTSHNGRDDHDAKRDRYFSKYGFVTLRIKTSEFRRDRAASLQRIKSSLVDRLCSGKPCRVPMVGEFIPKPSCLNRVRVKPLEIDTMPKPKKPPVASSFE